MSEKKSRKQWEGRTVDGRFSLQRYLGGSDHSAVFLTDRQDGAGNSGKRRAIKFISADAPMRIGRLPRWRVARQLDHPNLIRIFTKGRCDLDGVARSMSSWSMRRRIFRKFFRSAR